MEVKVKAIKCPTCGGTLQFDPATQITICSYCGSTSIIEAKDIGESKLQVDAIVPFQITKEKFVLLVKNWMRKGFFTRKDVSMQATIDKVQGIYLPFFVYDIKWAGQIEADIGYNKWVPYYDYSSKQQRERLETNWQPYQTQGELSFQMVGFASKAIKAKYFEFCEDSACASLKKAREFQEEYLLGFLSEPFSINDEQIFKERVQKKAWEKVDAYVHERLSGRGDTQKNIQYYSHLDYRARSVYFPFWLATYRYKEKMYEIVVDGSTGQITGSKPVSPIKILITLGLLIGVPLLFLMGILKGPKDNTNNITSNEFIMKAVVSVKRANIRSGPGTNYNITTVLTKGKEIRVVGEQGEWISIEYDKSGAGWIHKSLIQYIDDSLK